MSGGHFDYNQYRIDQITEDIKQLIVNNHIENDFGYANEFSEETIEEFEKAVKILKTAYVYVQRIDWLVSGDDGEESFHARLKEDLEKLNA